MALKGNLRDVGLNQLLNLIYLAHKTGALSVQSETSRADARLFFKEGKLIQASLDKQTPRLTDMMVKVGKLTSDQARAVQARSRVDTDKELGLLMIQNGILTQNDIIQGVKNYLLETVYQLFTWRSGIFRFDPNILPPEERITVAVTLDHLIIEGTRRVQEWEHLQDELPDLDVPLKFAERPDLNLRNVSLSVEQWKVVSFINSRNTIRQIASFLKIDEFQIRRIVYGLQTAGLIDVLPSPIAVAATAGAARPPMAVSPSPVGRNIISRVIDRLKSL
ncbi:MAG: DUF4388 domain-containing protein [Chloroflexi bacterium]|nr:DUF4388 domain-containing protein [Chloroflexota bacterium]